MESLLDIDFYGIYMVKDWYKLVHFMNMEISYFVIHNTISISSRIPNNGYILSSELSDLYLKKPSNTDMRLLTHSNIRNSHVKIYDGNNHLYSTFPRIFVKHYGNFNDKNTVLIFHTYIFSISVSETLLKDLLLIFPVLPCIPPSIFDCRIYMVSPLISLVAIRFQSHCS